MNRGPLSEAQAREIGALRNVLYRAYPTRRDYSFTFEYVNGAWRAFINNSPDYAHRPSGSHESHRLGIGTRPYVCWQPEATSLSMAQSVAALWADSTENYIATGVFAPAAGRPQVQDRSVLNRFAPAAEPGPRAGQGRAQPGNHPQRQQSRLARWWQATFG